MGPAAGWSPPQHLGLGPGAPLRLFLSVGARRGARDTDDIDVGDNITRGTPRARLTVNLNMRASSSTRHQAPLVLLPAPSRAFNLDID